MVGYPTTTCAPATYPQWPTRSLLAASQLARQGKGGRAVSDLVLKLRIVDGIKYLAEGRAGRKAQFLQIITVDERLGRHHGSVQFVQFCKHCGDTVLIDRKSTRLNSS